MRIKIPDILIILLAASLTGFSAFAAYAKPKAVRVLIRGQEREWTFPLDAEETVTVQGPLGNTVVRIHDSRAWVESSPCENQTCVASGHVRRQGAWAACLPNNVLLLIEGSNDEPEIDSIAW
ncbi:MAG: NusG domain II-containing protein [Treponema sp.]|jgi:hypothetical protein|nr:NusG domain II-containing protein [Treponema sp.]